MLCAILFSIFNIIYILILIMLRRYCPCFFTKEEQFVSHSVSKYGSDTCSVLPLDTVIRGLALGTVMYEIIDSNSWEQRKYKVNIQNLYLYYVPIGKPYVKDINTRIYISEIEEITTGWYSELFHSVKDVFKKSTWRATVNSHMRALLKEGNCFSIVIGPSENIIDLVAPNSRTRDAWVRGLNHLLAISKYTKKKTEYEKWIKDQVRNIDVDHTGSINFNECFSLLRLLNVYTDKITVKDLFDKHVFKKTKMSNQTTLDPEEFIQLYHNLTNRPELESLMKRHSVSKVPLLNAEELLQFFIMDQKQNSISIQKCKNIIDKYETKDEKDNVKGHLSVKGFCNMLLSNENNIFNKKHRYIYQDMTHPLNHYYIASSHNTYYLADQLIETSSVEGYVQALLKGCRCLELTVWDGPNDEPIIYDGFTETSHIFLKDVLICIKEYAFKYSQYPVILSLENHCTLHYQTKMSVYFMEILGDFLYKEPVGNEEKELPSPESLVRKIIIKGQESPDCVVVYTPDNLCKDEDDEGEEEDSCDDDDDEEEFKIRQDSTTNEDEELPGREFDVFVPAKLKKHSETRLNISNSNSEKNSTLETPLANLINYCIEKKFLSFKACEDWKFWEMASFQETKALKLISKRAKKFVKFNKTHLSRIYPKKSRANSNNFDPLPFWNVGCQLVALNYQTRGKFIFLNNAKFAPNGNCGYILKPRFLWDNASNYFPKEELDPLNKKHMIIKIISGQQIPKPMSNENEVVNPYVIIKIVGHPLDNQKFKTQHVINNGFDPIWDKLFLIDIHVPEFAMIIFAVKNNNFAGRHELLGKYALPFTSIKEGYRHVHLLDEKGDPLIPASIFVQITLAKY